LLPDPETCGSNSLEDVIADLKYTNNFTMQDISLEDLSQIIWAGYGCTPHTTYNGRAGSTVPSWCAEYYLTGNIYVVDQDSVFRYHNCNPGSDLTARDHRLEQIRAGDVRNGLRAAVRDLPDAPYYVVLCLDAENVNRWYARLETGFAAGIDAGYGMLVHDGVERGCAGGDTGSDRGGGVMCRLWLCLWGMFLEMIRVRMRDLLIMQYDCIYSKSGKLLLWSQLT
jgi:hypothetical protein